MAGTADLSMPYDIAPGSTPALDGSGFAGGMAGSGGAPGVPFASVLRGGPHAGGSQKVLGGGVAGIDGADDPSADAGDEPLSELHPAVRHAARLAPPGSEVGDARPVAPETAQVTAATGRGSNASGSALESRVAAASLEDLLPALVRSAAWGRDGRRATMHLEIGAGTLAGARVLIQAQGNHVQVRLAAPPAVRASVDLDEWRTRIAARLAARGLDVGAVEVE